jgi:hypothetical protein
LARNSIPGRGLLESGKIDPPPPVSHKPPLDEFERGVSFMKNMRNIKNMTEEKTV